MGVHVYVFYSEAVSDHACVLATCSPKAHQRVVADVMAAFDTDLFDGVGHVVRGDI